MFGLVAHRMSGPSLQQVGIWDLGPRTCGAGVVLPLHSNIRITIICNVNASSS